MLWLRLHFILKKRILFSKTGYKDKQKILKPITQKSKNRGIFSCLKTGTTPEKIVQSNGWLSEECYVHHLFIQHIIDRILIISSGFSQHIPIFRIKS